MFWSAFPYFEADAELGVVRKLFSCHRSINSQRFIAQKNHFAFLSTSFAFKCSPFLSLPPKFSTISYTYKSVSYKYKFIFSFGVLIFCVFHQGRNSLSQHRLSQYFTDCANMQNLKIWLQSRYVTYVHMYIQISNWSFSNFIRRSSVGGLWYIIDEQIPCTFSTGEKSN